MEKELLTRRDLLRGVIAAAAAVALPAPLTGCGSPARDVDPGAETALSGDTTTEAVAAATPEDGRRLLSWTRSLREEGFGDRDLGLSAARVGELSIGTPYEAFTLEEYLRSGGSPMRTEPLTLSLTRFDCVSLVESCIAIARVARKEDVPVAGRGSELLWSEFASEMERMRYRGGNRGGYATRLHYFSDWMNDNERRGLVRTLGEELGGELDERPLRFMSSNPDAYAAMADPQVREQIAEMERSLDQAPRWVIPSDRIPEISGQLQTGDILAFATAIEGLDVTHSAFAYRDGRGVLRVLHAPLSGGVVEITTTTLPQYVANIRRSTGILVARPLAA